MDCCARWCGLSVGAMSRGRSCRIEGHEEESAGFSRALRGEEELPLSRALLL